MLMDTLADALSQILNAEKVGKSEVNIMPVSKIMVNVIKMMKDRGYLGDYEIIDNKKGRILKLKLVGKINKCGVIKPRFSVKLSTYEKYEKRYLPAKDFGILIVSTPKGLMTHLEAKSKSVGGKLIAYVY
ncbi:MAG: 30S ribosomal protein S8 [Candidatus Nanoarchaeia archaeon]|nr:30S ribosomal protein S8 [Candidatus Nanoarchaeia archaeon]